MIMRDTGCAGAEGWEPVQDVLPMPTCTRDPQHRAPVLIRSNYAPGTVRQQIKQFVVDGIYFLAACRTAEWQVKTGHGEDGAGAEAPAAHLAVQRERAPPFGYTMLSYTRLPQRQLRAHSWLCEHWINTSLRGPC